MSNLPVVYSTQDRHALLMELARKVTLQVKNNPDHRDHHERDDEYVIYGHKEHSGK